MSKKPIKDFASLRSLWKKTETEAEAKAALKGAEVSLRKLPRKPLGPIRTSRQMSATDKFIVDTLAISLEQLSLEQLNDARITIQDAMECVNYSLVSIQRQLDNTVEGHYKDQDHDWKQRAEAALRFKSQEGQGLHKQMALVDELIARAKPALKLVTSPPPPKEEAPAPAPQPVVAAPYEIRTNAPRPNVHQSEEWRKYPFDKLGIDQSFRFGDETPDQVRRLITAAQRNLGRHFSYRRESDGVIAVWRVEGPSPSRRRKRD